MYEHLEIPVLQISIPTSYNINQLIELGEKLQQFKDEALIICSGGITHNLGDMSMNPNVRNYAKDFNNDMIDIIENANCGYKVIAGKQEEMQMKLGLMLEKDLKEMGNNAEKLLLNNYTVNQSYHLIIEKI